MCGRASSLPAGIEKQARVIEGSLTDKDALLSAMEDIDTVVNLLGAYMSLTHFVLRTKPTPIGDAFPGILSAMRAKGVKRIFALSTPSYSPDPTEKFSFQWTVNGLIPKVVVPQGNAEMVAIAKAVAAANDLDWTVFRVPMLTEESADLPVAAGLLGPNYKGTKYLSRASMAVWILEEIEKRQWVKKAPMLGNY
ncbi:NAD(P)-binding protein [Mycena venus]|uniref:NAD(P)-binding protein n=1 Tax=Mycena venus TaxID=2733690 RepID=A0A8H6Y1Z4_9AGAR|nr:NAD(P)-binding protein [Mycena venus]